MSKFLSHDDRAVFVKALAKRQGSLLTGKANAELEVSHGDIGGQAVARLNVILRDYANGRCVVCRQATSLTVKPRHLTAATVAVLIPCAAIDASNERRGYTAGNCASICRACVNKSARIEKATGTVHVWLADTLDAEFVPLAWPSLPKLKPVLDAEEVAHAANADRVWAARGIS